MRHERDRIFQKKTDGGDGMHTGFSGRNKLRKEIDMAYVYREIDRGRTLKSLSKELGVSRSTLYRRHHRYQEMSEGKQTGKGNINQEPSIPDIDL